MKILIDTNVILDVLSDRKPFSDAAKQLFRLSETNRVTGVVSAFSFPNLVYILRKELDAEKIQQILNKLMLIFDIADLKAIDLQRVASLGFSDFEDALQSACASRIRADYIVTRNLKDFAKSKVPAISPSDLLRML